MWYDIHVSYCIFIVERLIGWPTGIPFPVCIIIITGYLWPGDARAQHRQQDSLSRGLRVLCNYCQGHTGRRVDAKRLVCCHLCRRCRRPWRTSWASFMYVVLRGSKFSCDTLVLETRVRTHRFFLQYIHSYNHPVVQQRSPCVFLTYTVVCPL